MNLEQFLDGEKKAGVSQGTGSFTISIESARTKLQKYLLASREEWIKKLIQAVSGWRVNKLEVKQTRTDTVLHFQPSLRFGLPSGADILRTFLEAELEGRHPLNRFCQALHTLRELESLSFYLAINDGKGGPVVYHDGPHASATPPKGSPQAHFSNAPGITLGISHKTDGEKESWFPWPFTSPPGKRLMTDLAVALSAASMTAPVPIVLDSKRLDRLESGPHSKVLAVRGLELFHRGDKPIVLPRYLFELLEEEERSGSAQGDDRIYSGYMLLKFSRARQRSFFCFVDDGAVLERLYLPSTPSISYQVYVNGQGLSTDLGGLSLLGTKPRQIRIDRAFEEVRRKLAEFCEVGGLPEGVSGGLEGELRELASEPMWVTEAGT